jgi:hypothetical protein
MVDAIRRHGSLTARQTTFVVSSNEPGRISNDIVPLPNNPFTVSNEQGRLPDDAFPLPHDLGRLIDDRVF